MPTLGTFAGLAARAFRALKRQFLDTFNRTTSGSLGTASSGFTWVANKGTWFANGSQAQSNDSATNYSVASVDAGSQDVIVSASVSNGCGPAVWVSGAGSWYASVVYLTTSTECCGGYTCSCGSSTACCGDCACPSQKSCCSPCYCQPTCTGCGTYTICDVCPAGYDFVGFTEVGSIGTCSNGQNTVPSSCRTEDRTDCACPDSTDCCPSPCPCPASNACCTSACSCGNDCCCATCTVTSYWLRLLRAVGGSVSTVSSDVSISSAASAIKMVTSNNTITSTAYSNTSMTSSLGSRNDTPSSPTKTTSHGIVKAPSGSSQGSTIDNFSAE